jgi:hypothetical protein
MFWFYDTGPFANVYEMLQITIDIQVSKMNGIGN